MTSKNKEQIAVFHFIYDSEKREVPIVHASVPYISCVQNPQYPYYKATIDPSYKEVINRTIRSAFRDYGLMGTSRQPRNEFKKRGIAERSERQNFYTDSLLHETAKKITKLFELDDIFDFLFSLSKEKVTLLQIVTSEPNIPWDWIYNDESKKMLCEVFGIGVTFHELPKWGLMKNCSLSLSKLKESNNSAMIIGNSYSTSTSIEQRLFKMDQEIDITGEQVKEIFGEEHTHVYKNMQYDELKKAFEDNLKDLRLIYLSGHFDENGFLMQDNKHLTAQSLDYILKTRSFSSHPIVIFNGCSSLYSSHNLSFLSDHVHGISKKFLELGAAACISTTTDIRFDSAMKFAKYFFFHFFEPGASIGTALRRTRVKMREDKCFEWASYNLMGDPSYILIKHG